jgi:hypothetical protein
VAENSGSGVKSVGDDSVDELVDVSEVLDVVEDSLLVVSVLDVSVGAFGVVLDGVLESVSGTVVEVMVSSGRSSGGTTITSAPLPPGIGRRTAVAA